MPEERLQKILSRAGVASRRKAEQLILEGRVTVNGAAVIEMGSKADLDRDHIRVDGKLLHSPKRLAYIALHKPNNCVTTVTDPEGRPTVMDLLRGVKERVYPVGRLDYHSEGLLLLTNDGELASKLTHASSHVPKTYLVKSSLPLTDDQLDQLRRGVTLTDGPTRPATVKRIRDSGRYTFFEITITEGRNRQVRRMVETLGAKVLKLVRTEIGTIRIEDLQIGKYRALSDKEVRGLT